MRTLSILSFATAGLVAAWGVSGCGDDTSASGGSGGVGGAVTAASTSQNTVTSVTTGGGAIYVGQTCTNDSQCGPMGTCIQSGTDDPRLGGGPANGYCTQACQDSAECPGDGLCLVSDGVGECFLGCTMGEPVLEFLNTELDANKCHGREDLRCQEIDGTAICIPTCGKDAQCGGRSCDPALAVCVDTPKTGIPMGDACDTEANPSECAGICLNFTSGQSMCSQWCVLGGELDGNDCGGLDNGICVFRPSGNEVGDYAFCTPSCEAQTDCQNPNFWCFSNNFAQNGYCFGATACPAGQSDCTGANICTTTPNGPFCLDPVFPLDGAGGGGTGGAGMGGAGVGGAGMGGAGGGT